MEYNKLKTITSDFHGQIDMKLAGEGYGFFMNKEKVRSYYNLSRIGFYYDIVFQCIEHGVVFNNKSIGDFACGGGFLFKAVNEASSPSLMEGFDLLQDAVDFARIFFPYADFSHQRIMHDYKKKWDVVIATEVLEHMVDPDETLFALWERVSANGYLIITVPDGRVDNLGASEFSANSKSYVGHINFWSPESFHLYIEKVFGQYQLYCGVIKDITGVLDKNYAVVCKGQV